MLEGHLFSHKKEKYWGDGKQITQIKLGYPDSQGFFLKKYPTSHSAVSVASEPWTALRSMEKP